MILELISKSLKVYSIFFILLFVITASSVIPNNSNVQFNHIFKEHSVIIPMNEQWNKSYGGLAPDGLFCVQETNDTGLIMTGYTYSYSQGKEDVWLVKTDCNGVELWNTSFGGPNHDEGLSVIETKDNGFMIFGKTDSKETSSSDAWLIKTDRYGNKQWDKTFGNNQTEIGRQILTSGDDEYVLIGISQTYDKTNCFIIKVNTDGIIQWNQSLNPPTPYSSLNVFSAVQTEDNGYLLTGQLYSHTNGSDGFLLKINHIGQFEWIKNYGQDQTDFFKSLHLVPDGVILIGTTSSYNSRNFDIWVVKTDLDGNEVWNTTIGGIEFDEGFDIQPCFDTGYLITGYTNSYGAGQSDIWIVKTNQDGVEQWNKSFGGEFRDVGYNLVATTVSGYVIVGGYGGDGWVIKLNSLRSIDFKPSLIIGQIDHLERSQNISWFLSDNIVMIQFDPIQINRYFSNEKIFIDNQYLGFINQRFIIGLFQASII